MIRQAAAFSVLMAAFSPAYANGLTPAAPAAAGICYVSGSSGPTVPCVQQDQTWVQVLGTKDRADDLTVDSRRLGDFISGAGGKTTLTPDALQILGPGAVPIGTLYTGSGQVVLGAYQGGAVGNSIAMDGTNTYLNGPVTAYQGGTMLSPNTYGGNGSAAGYTFSTNGLIYGIPNWLAQPSMLSTYASRDHAGMTRSMRAPVSVTVPGSGSTYTANTVQNASLAIDGNIKLGMVIDTRGAPRYSGVITGINAGTKTLTVNAWYRVDGSSQTGTPTSGTGAIINPASKLWISNDILYCGEPEKYDVACAGTELNVNISDPRVVEAYGYDAVIYGTSQPAAAYAFPARWGGSPGTKWRAAVYGQDNLGGLYSYQTLGTAYNVPLIEARVGNDNTFLMDHMGKMSALRLQAIGVSASTTLDRFVGGKVFGTQTAAITLTLPNPADVNDGREIEVINYGSGPITVNRLNGSNAGTVGEAYSQRFFAYQNNWLPISKTPIN